MLMMADGNLFEPNLYKEPPRALQAACPVELELAVDSAACFIRILIWKNGAGSKRDALRDDLTKSTLLLGAFAKSCHGLNATFERLHQSGAE